MSTMGHGVIDKQALPEMSISANCGGAAATEPGPEETRLVRVRKSGPGGEWKTGQSLEPGSALSWW